MEDDKAHEPVDDRTYDAPAVTSLGTAEELAVGNEDATVGDSGSPT